MTIGVYSLVFPEGSTYIGISNNISKRVTNHFYLLRLGTHNNSLVQAKYVTYGIPHSSILEECQESELSSKEKYYVNLVPADKILNLATPGRFGAGQPGELHGCSIHSNETIVKVFNHILDGMSYTHIVEITGVKYHTVANISSGHAHCWLREVFKDVYDEHVKKHTNYKEYIVVCPLTQNLFTVTNQTVFAKENKLNYSNFSRMLKGFRNTCQGWKLATEALS